jgi:hypothetical protein
MMTAAGPAAAAAGVSVALSSTRATGAAAMPGSLLLQKKLPSAGTAAAAC